MTTNLYIKIWDEGEDPFGYNWTITTSITLKQFSGKGEPRIQESLDQAMAINDLLKQGIHICF
jgi:hypothetical protein